jgi:hypothetical protein
VLKQNSPGNTTVDRAGFGGDYQTFPITDIAEKTRDTLERIQDLFGAAQLSSREGVEIALK